MDTFWVVSMLPINKTWLTAHHLLHRTHMTQGPAPPCPPGVLLRNYRQNYFMWLRQRETQPGLFMPTAPLLPERQRWAPAWSLSDTSFQGWGQWRDGPPWQGSPEHRLWLSSQSRSWAHQRRVRRHGSVPPLASAGPSLSIPICRDSQGDLWSSGMPSPGWHTHVLAQGAALPQTPRQSSTSAQGGKASASLIDSTFAPESWLVLKSQSSHQLIPFHQPHHHNQQVCPFLSNPPACLLFVPFLPQELFRTPLPSLADSRLQISPPPSRWCIFLNIPVAAPALHCHLLGSVGKPWTHRPMEGKQMTNRKEAGSGR